MNSFSLLTVLLSFFTTITIDAYDTIPGHDCLRSMEGMMDSMWYLAEDNPNLISITDIGDSWLKANPNGLREIPGYDTTDLTGHDIFALNITARYSVRTSDEKGKMLLTSGVHAREYAPAELLGRFIEMLVNGYKNDDSDIKWIMQHTEVHAILYVNPDGRWIAERYPELYWRKNLNPNGGCNNDEEYGTDLNRNMNFFWGDLTDGAASDNPCDSDYHGQSAESEPETQAISDYAKRLFPAGQRKDDPEGDKNVAFGEDNTGMYCDIHASGGYVYYPWGHEDSKSPNDAALQPLGRKMNYFNGYKLWAGSHPDFVYPASGDLSDWAYGVLGVASMGFEIGDDFYQECNLFENTVVPNNLPALLFAAKTVGKPFMTLKGPDMFELEATPQASGQVAVTAQASDGKMVDAIDPDLVNANDIDFPTGNQIISNVRVYLDVHPDDYQEGVDVRYEMQPPPNPNNLAGGFSSGEENVSLTIGSLGSGKHTLFVQATDSDGYRGTVSSVNVDIPVRRLRGSS
jgi:hypothetical protein